VREFVDDLQRRLEVPGRPRRIVSLVPSLTETLFAFGLDDAIVGVTRFCVEPSEFVEHKAKVGGPKNPDLDAIRRRTAKRTSTGSAETAWLSSSPSPGPSATLSRR
jgi:ABC-type Fe3+-hydroxamate transport system substrate-binding protein